MPWSASSGTTKKMRTRLRPTSPAASAASAGRRLFDDDVLKGRPREYREDPVVQGQEEQVVRALRRHARADAADHERDRQRQEQERQDQLARAARRRHRREQRADGADANVGERDARERGRVERLEEEREGGQ